MLLIVSVVIALSSVSGIIVDYFVSVVSVVSVFIVVNFVIGFTGVIVLGENTVAGVGSFGFFDNMSAIVSIAGSIPELMGTWSRMTAKRMFTHLTILYLTAFLTVLNILLCTALLRME